MGSWLKDSLRSFSVAQKITIIVTTTSCVALLLSSTVLIGHHITSNRVKMVKDLSTLATVVGNNSEPALTDGDRDRADHLLSALSANKELVSAITYNEKGFPFARYDRDEISLAEAPPAVEPAGARFLTDALILFTPVFKDNLQIGTVYIKADLTLLNESTKRYALIALVGLIVSALLAYLFASMLRRVITGPIELLAEAARKVSEEHDFSVRVEKVGDDELGVLTDGFNEMLRQMWARNKQIQKSRIELELRVEQRTRDLEISKNLSYTVARL